MRITYIQKNKLKHEIPRVLDRLRVIDIRSSKEYHDYLKCLPALHVQLPNLLMIAIDDLSYFYHDAYLLKHLVGARLERRQFIQAHINFFWQFSKTLEISIIYLLPEHLNEIDYITDHEEELRVYNSFRKFMKMSLVSFDEMMGIDLDSSESSVDSEEQNEKLEQMFFPLEPYGPVVHVPDIKFELKKSGEHFIMQVTNDRYNCDKYAPFKIGDRGIEWL